MNACLSPEGIAAYTQAATIIAYAGTAAAVAWVVYALWQDERDEANRQRRIDNIEPEWRATSELRADDYYRNGGEI